MPPSRDERETADRQRRTGRLGRPFLAGQSYSSSPAATSAHLVVERHPRRSIARVASIADARGFRSNQPRIPNLRGGAEHSREPLQRRHLRRRVVGGDEQGIERRAVLQRRGECAARVPRP